MSLNLFFELSRDLFCIRTDGYFEPLNSAWENVLGWTGSELRSRPWIDFVHPDDVQLSLSAETQCTQKDAVEYENRYRHKNGSYCWLSWRVSRNLDGCIYAVATNITAEKDAEKALHKYLIFERLEEQLRLLLDAANIGFWDWNIQTGAVTLSNNLEQLFGWVPNTFDGTFETFVATVHPDDRDSFRDSYASRIHSRTQHSLKAGEDRGIEFRVVWADGSIRWMESKGRVFFDETGKARRAIGFNLDITDRKLAEEQLRQSEEQLRLALDAANMGFWAWNIQSGTVTWSDNFKRIFGLPLDIEEGSYELFLSIVHPEDRDRVHQASISSFESGQNGDIDYRIVWPDGSIHWIETMFQFFFDETGKPIRKTGIDLDVSDRKLAELQLQESLREKEVLLQEIHHRVKNNLQVICSLLDLQSQRIQEPAMQEMFRESYNRIKSMALVHEKLYQYRNFVSINFADYIESLTNDLFYAYRVKACLITFELDIDEITLNIDTAIPCALIINELVSNALKYAFTDSQEGKIRIAIHTEDSTHFTLVVRDSGKGLPKGLDLNNTKSLGLRLVNVLTNQLEGALEIDCRSGTEFRISFSELRR
jgi:PAS domain S-box-containing protein